jgi:hypothetical protein
MKAIYYFIVLNVDRMVFVLKNMSMEIAKQCIIIWLLIENNGLFKLFRYQC